MSERVPTYAYCFRNGRIEFGNDVPKGALIIGALDAAKRDRIVARARFSRVDNETMFVPGIPEAESDDQALDALIAFIDWAILENRPKALARRAS